MEWIRQVFESTDLGLAIIPASLILGFLTAFSSCCNFGIIAVVAGFAGSGGPSLKRKELILTSVFFLAGTTLAMAGLGLLVGYFGKFTGENFGSYGLVVTGFLAIIFGLITLDLLPFKIPSFKLPNQIYKSGIIGASLFGLGIGVASVSCTLACHGPLLPVILGFVAAQGEALWGGVILTMFAIGYSLPLALLIFGIGMGRLTSIAQKLIKPIRLVTGMVLILVGFYPILTA